jgi:hypothetical protein
MALGYVRNLMGKHASHFVFVAACFQQACVYAYVAAWQRKRVNAWIVDGEERETMVTVIGLCGDSTADVIQVLGY